MMIESAGESMEQVEVVQNVSVGAFSEIETGSKLTCSEEPPNLPCAKDGGNIASAGEACTSEPGISPPVVPKKRGRKPKGSVEARLNFNVSEF
jgi:hypothetical protein